MPSGSFRQTTERCPCCSRWSSSSDVRLIHAAIARPSCPAGTSTASATSADSFSPVATRVSVRTLVYDRTPASNSRATSDRLRSARPTRIHSRAVHTSMSALVAIQCAADGDPDAAHSPESANSAASTTTVRWSFDQFSIASPNAAVRGAARVAGDREPDMTASDRIDRRSFPDHRSARVWSSSLDSAYFGGVTRFPGGASADASALDG